MDGILYVVINSDTECDVCGKLLDISVGWAVMTEDGKSYHVPCAVAVEWTPSIQEQRYIARWPEGPYA